MKRQRDTTQHQHRSGATVVEFALVAPIFFFLLLVGIEFCVLGTIRSTAHNAAYEGARILVVPGANADDGIAEAKRIMSIVGVGNFSINVTPSLITEDTQQVTVDISIPYDDNAIFTPYVAGGLTINSSVTLKTERYGGMAIP